MANDANTRTPRPKLKETDPKKYYSRVKGWCKAGTLTSLFTPLVAVFGAKWNEYIQITESDGASGTMKLSVGAVLSLITAAIVIYKYVRHDERQKNQVTMLSWVVGLGLAFGICWAFSAILQDLTLILGTEFAGSVAAYGFDLGVQHADEKLKPYEEEMMRASARRDFARQEEDRNNNRGGGTPVE